MMRGQGFSSCLICKDDSGLVFASKFVRMITKACFITDDFEVMLSATKMCYGCIGRIQQLHQFLTHKNALKDTVLENPEKSCRFCYIYYESGIELLDERTEMDFKILVSTTPFAGEILSQQISKCCYSCVNFLAMWKDYKEIMKECLLIFERNVKSCTVVVNRNVSDEIKKEVLEDESSVEDVGSSDQNSNITDAIAPPELQDSPTSVQNQSEIPQETNHQELTTEHVEQIKDRENENSSKTKENNPQRRGKSVLRGDMQLQDLNDNIVVRRSRRETSVPAKFAEFNNSNNIGATNRRSRTESIPFIKKRSGRYRGISMPPCKKTCHNESQSRAMTESELISFYNIVPCRVFIEQLPIEKPKKVRKAPTKQTNRRTRKTGLKVKLTPAKKVKLPKTKVSSLSPENEKFSRPAIFPMPFDFKSEPVDREAVVQLTPLIISEDLPPSLVISEDFCEKFNNNTEKVHAQELIQTAAYTSVNVNMIDHEEIVDAMETVEETVYAQQYTEIEFIRHPHRNRETVELSDCNENMNQTEPLVSSTIAS